MRMCAQLSTQPYKGTRDFYPADMEVRQWMFNQLRKVLTRFGYQEYDGPMLEPFELYASKTSEEIVNEQLYWLVDRGERKLAIRPEMTPTLARMIAAKQNELPRPMRWFSIPNLWRYERPQRGRLREHWQLNVDVFGGSAPAEDFEICTIITSIMENFNAHDQYEVRLNHRGLTNFIFQNILKLSDTQIPTIGRLLDAAPKMGHEGFQESLKKEGLAEKQIEFLLTLLTPDASIRLQSELNQNEHFHYLNQLLEKLNAFGLGKRFKYDPAIMRGFLYYTGLVFEVYDLHPENNRALFGGGRYEDLVGMFTGKPLPGVGFGMGDVTLRNFLETHKLMPNFKAPHAVYVAHLNEPDWFEAQKLGSQLRQHIPDRAILSALSAEKPKKIFTSAEKLNARFVIFVGPDEIRSSRYSVKDLVSGTQTQGTLTELVTLISSLQ